MNRHAGLAFCVLLSLSCYAADPPPPWSEELRAGRRAFGEGKYADAVTNYRAALAKAEEGKAAPAALLPILQNLATALRTGGSSNDALEILTRVLTIERDLHGEASPEAASALSAIAAVQRAQGDTEGAAISIAKALQIRMSTGAITGELAKDATLAGAIQNDMAKSEAATNYYLQAVAFWGALPASGLQILTAIDPLAGIYRNLLDYTAAESMYKWALRLREAALGPKDSELIGTLDSLAYVLFGQKKYEEAEPVYQRLLSIWEGSAGAEHPMVALTLDKMAEFYSAQKLYEKAAPLAQRSLAIRTKTLIETYHRTGRVLVGEQKFPEALDLYERVARIGTDAKVPDEQMDGILRSYAMLLRQAKREPEAAKIEARVKEALLRKADKEGRRPAPPARPQ